VSYRSWQAEDFYYLTDLATSYEARDLAMAAIEEATRTLKFPNQKAVVWAHNYHLTRNHTEVSELGLGMTNTMGSVLSKDLGASYKAFALIGYDVEINWPGVGMGQTTPPTKKALESTLHALGRDTLFLDFMTPAIAPLVPMDKEILFNAPSEIKAIGPHQFDGAFFLDKSPPMDALYW
jgi:erythromycin esterase-like protein